MNRESWGRFPKANHRLHSYTWRDEALPRDGVRGVLPYGQGRSYGDSCLNDGGTLVLTRGLNHFIEFGHHTGLLRAEAGVTLEEILSLVVPQGWFLPVAPGTQYASLGGGVANDIHGKNHHIAGTLGRFVTRFELMRSDGVKLICSPTENDELYRATIGGLGLTGLILWVELQLKPIRNPWIASETIKFGSLQEFFEISHESERDFEYTVAWIDCLSSGKNLGRGLFMRGNHAPAQIDIDRAIQKRKKFSVPVDAPSFSLNRLSLSAFNFAYYNKQLSAKRQSTIHYAPFFFPLDSVGHWNRIYGKQGFFQYQCVVPYTRSGTQSNSPIKTILEEISKAGTGSFLAVLKTFGDIGSPGILSFPRPGVTLALDFPNTRKCRDLFDRLDEVVLREGGAIYPAKDARMSPELFKQAFPRWREFSQFIDPQFSSSFWRRVTER